jgi:hypothetical protein
MSGKALSGKAMSGKAMSGKEDSPRMEIRDDRLHGWAGSFAA